MNAKSGLPGFGAIQILGIKLLMFSFCSVAKADFIVAKASAEQMSDYVCRREGERFPGIDEMSRAVPLFGPGLTSYSHPMNRGGVVEGFMNCDPKIENRMYFLKAYQTGDPIDMDRYMETAPSAISTPSITFPFEAFRVSRVKIDYTRTNPDGTTWVWSTSMTAAASESELDRVCPWGPEEDEPVYANRYRLAWSFTFLNDKGESQPGFSYSYYCPR